MKLVLGDCLEQLRLIPESSIDAIVTDPPYGWRFMGKAWDGADIEKKAKADISRSRPGDAGRKRGAVRSAGSLAGEAGSYDLSLTGNQAFQAFTNEWAIEAIRVLKPGGHVLIFCGPRTYHRMACGVEDAGFEIRDQLQWLFGSGFPKSLDVGKAIPARKGFGTALKPANEPILLARKPLSEKTVAANVLKWGTGAINVDGCRIRYDGPVKHAVRQDTVEKISPNGWRETKRTANRPATATAAGRFPANLILDEEAARMLDEQSGALKSGAPGIKHGGNDGSTFGKESRAPGTQMTGFGDTGGASRFFYCAKASRRERNEGLEGFEKRKSSKLGGGIRSNVGNGAPGASSSEDRRAQNHHPTVKPVTLMRYLCRLITPPGGAVLDPFMGSGTTGIAAKHEGFDFVGIEREKEYFHIAEKRISNTQIEGVENEDQPDLWEHTDSQHV